MAAVEANAAAPAPALPLSPPRVSASAPPTVGALLTRVSAATVTNSGGASRDRNRECSSPRSLLSRILHRRRGGGFGCRLRLPLPRYCSSGAAKEDTAVVATVAAKEEAAVPKVVASRAEPRESPRSSLSGKKDAVPAASLGLGASLVLLLSKSAAELSRMAELRAQMERLMLDVRADVRSSCNGGRPSASDGPHTDTDSASVVKEPGDVDEAALSPSRGFPASRGGSEDAGHRETMDQMEAELEAELSRLQQMAANGEENVTPLRDQEELEIEEAKIGATSGSPLSVICSDSDIDDGATDHDGGESQEEDDEEEDNDGDESDAEEQAKSPPHSGVSARELERRLHELLQSRHETRIAELEAALERARRKLKEKEREACRWRDTAKLAARFTDDSRLR
ncbi:hypothetical protein EJB05_19420, partial [Eragrostis curvula]